MGATPARVREIFLAALEAEDRATFLDEACEQDAELRGRVEELLRSHELAGDFLTPPSTSYESLEAAEGPGTTIDRYTLIEPIGEGGFGDVYLAEQTEPIRREVALKIIKPGMDTRQVIARFQAERQALALMDHPGIAKVYDAGATETGRPYFVMELVHGVPITKYCDENQLTASDRLKLFIEVCGAVQHAHQKGIIHRDIKPTNVLVTLQDGRPVPKIIDFGIAKATQQRLTEKTVFTEHRQLLGTPEYMSPEQAEFSGRDVDTRSDIYSMGVLLYELLVGTPPFDLQDLRGRGYDEICRLICESTPPTPSKRLSSLGDRIIDVAQQRRIQQRDLWKLFRGDLDWIVMKCLEKDRTRRYETVSALARDVDRFLNNRPVDACPPTPSYRVRKFVRRNSILVYTAMAVLLMLLIGSVSTTIGLLQARYQARRAGVALQRLTESVTQTEREREIAEEQRLLAEQLSREEKAARQEAEQHRDQAHQNLYHAEMRLGSRFLAKGQIRQLHSVLDRYLPQPDQPDLRGWEWYYFLTECHRDLFTLRGHTDLVCDVAWSPTRSQLASASRDGTVKIWDASTGKEIRTLHGHHAYVLSLAWSPDGERLASAGRFGRIRVWNADTGQTLLSIQHGDGHIRWLGWCLDGRQLASKGGGSDPTVRIWDSNTGQSLVNLTDHGNDRRSLVAVAMSSDGKRLALGYVDGRIQILDVATGQKVLSLRGPRRDLGSMTWSPDGRRLAKGSSNGTVIWDAETGQQVLTFREHAGRNESLAWSPDGKLLAEGTRDAIRIWNAATGREVRMIGGHARSVAWNADSQRLATCSGFTAKIWDVSQEPEPDLHHGASRVSSLAWSPNGRQLASASWDETIKIWEASTGAEVSIATGHTDSIDAVAWSPDGKRLASGSRDGTARIWDVARAGLLHTLSGHGGEVNTVAWSPEGRVLALAGRPGAIKIWDTETEREQRTLTADGRQVNSVTWNPEGTLLAAACEAWNAVAIWDTRMWREIHSISGPMPGPPFSHIRAVAWSPDGARLLILADEMIGVWSAETAEIVFWIRGHSGGNNAVAWSPDGHRFVSTGEDQTVKIWHTATGQEIASLSGHKATLSSVAFSPDGYRIASGRSDGTIKIWNASPGFELTETPEYLLDLAERAAVIGRGDQAIKVLQKLIERWTDVPEYRTELAKAYRARGRLLRDEGQLNQSITAYTKAIQSDATFVAAHTGRGHTFTRLGAWDKAIADYSEAIRFDSGWLDQAYDEAYMNRAIAYSKKGDVDKAIADCKAIRLGTSPTAQNRVAWFLITSPDASARLADQAVQLALRAVELSPKKATYWNSLGVAYYRAGDWTKAIESLEQSVVLSSGADSFDGFFLAMAHWRLGDKQEARRWYDQAIEWMEENKLDDDQLRRFRAEAAELLELGTTASAENEKLPD